MSPLRLSLSLAAIFSIVGLAPAQDAPDPEGEASPPKKVLIIGQGPDGHPAGQHEFMASARVMEKLLASYDSIETTVAKADEPWPEGPALIDQADGVVMFVTEGARWLQNDPRRYEAITKMLQRGGGLVAIHWSVGAKDGQYMEKQLQILGGSRGGPDRKYTFLETDVQVLAPDHPIVTGVQDYRVEDEFYYHLDLLQKGEHVITPLLSAKIEGQDEICGWAFEPEVGGRAFGFVCLHYHKNWELPHYRRLVVQGLLWTLKMPIPEGGVDTTIDPEVLRLTAQAGQ